MILFDKICSTDIEHYVVAQSPYYNINMLSIGNKDGERAIFISFFFLQNTSKFPRSGNINLFWAYLAVVTRVLRHTRTYSHQGRRYPSLTFSSRSCPSPPPKKRFNNFQAYFIGNSDSLKFFIPTWYICHVCLIYGWQQGISKNGLTRRFEGRISRANFVIKFSKSFVAYDMKLCTPTQ